MDLVIFWVCLIGGIWLFGPLIGAALPRDPSHPLYERRLREGACPYEEKGDW